MSPNDVAYIIYNFYKKRFVYSLGYWYQIINNKWYKVSHKYKKINNNFIRKIIFCDFINELRKLYKRNCKSYEYDEILLKLLSSQEFRHDVIAICNELFNDKLMNKLTDLALNSKKNLCKNLHENFDELKLI
ncbi:MAG: hypothetical protein Terrestrivirus1_223 [Terrestrivirus sp.]|uniref:Uncharacterized protein n=1 Tax=Terrestrivirus sp. TaxID=2487775 RepID=A0A3G4ZPI0_9VIRU|nr:MAG: hypothetical protein Terrestrivirus1_223 [Terrestrivirus sp.]